MRSTKKSRTSWTWRVLQKLFILTGRELTSPNEMVGLALNPDRRGKFKRACLNIKNSITFADLATELRAVKHRRRIQMRRGEGINYAVHGATPGEHACLTLRYDAEKKGATFFKTVGCPKHYGVVKQKHNKYKIKEDIKKVNKCIEQIASAQEHGEFAIADCGDDKSGWGVFNGYKIKYACPFWGMSPADHYRGPFACTALKDAIGLSRGNEEESCECLFSSEQRDFLRHGDGNPVLAEFSTVASKENDPTMTNSDKTGQPLLDADGQPKAFQSQVFVHTFERGKEMRLMGGVVQFINHACERCATHAHFNWTAESPYHEGKKRLPIVQRWPVLLPGVQVTLCYENDDESLSCVGPFCRPDQWMGVRPGVYDGAVLVPEPLVFTNGCSSVGIDPKRDDKKWGDNIYEIGAFLPNSIEHVPACLRSHPWRPRWYDYIGSSSSSSSSSSLSPAPPKVLITPTIMELVPKEWRQSDLFKKNFKFGLGNGLALRPSTCPGGGMGLFATTEIKQGEWITFYDGIALVDHGSAEHADRNCWKKSLGQELPIIVGFTSSDFMGDPLNEEWPHVGAMSLSNSSKWSKQPPNAKEQKYQIQKIPILWGVNNKQMPTFDLPALKAHKPIRRDEEIFWNYDPNYKE